MKGSSACMYEGVRAHTECVGVLVFDQIASVFMERISSSEEATRA